MLEPFDLPENVITDPVTGYTINMPLGPQDYPGWQEDRPDVIKRIESLRKDRKITVEDDMFLPKPQDKLAPSTQDRPRRKVPLPTARRSQ